ncbi:MAG: glycosyltransferase family 39 protein [Chloroflexales bacterium]|nr:glycosyltransferase family 39 protein [Chloroflexales bacterium]
MTWKQWLSNMGFWLTLVTMIGAGCLYLALSLLSYASVKAFVDVSFSAESPFFTEARFARIVQGSRLIGATLLLGAGVMYALRKWLIAAAQRLAESAGVLLGTGCSALVAWARQESRMHQAALVGVIALAGALRISFLFQPIRYDEAGAFLSYASKPIYYGLSNYSSPNNHLFHTLLVHITTKLLGDAEWALRLPAFTAGMLLVLALYALIRTLYNRHAALLAAALAAASSFLVEYSTNARGYTLISLLFLLLLGLAAYLVRRPQEPATWLFFALLGAIGFYTIPVMLYGFGSAALWLLLALLREPQVLPRRTLLRRYALMAAATVLLTLLLYLPVLAASGWQAVVANSYVQPLSTDSFLAGLPGMLATVEASWHRDLPTAVGGVLAGGALMACLLHRRLSPYQVAPAWALALWLPALLLVHHVLPYTRVWLFLLPLYLGLAAAGLTGAGMLAAGALPRCGLGAFGSSCSHIGALATVALSATLALGVAQANTIPNSLETGTLRDAKAITHSLRAQLHPGDRVVAIAPSDHPLAYYFHRYGLAHAYLNARPDGRSAERTFVVVNRSHQQSLTQILTTAGLDAAAITKDAVLLRRYATADLYLLAPSTGGRSMQPL